MDPLFSTAKYFGIKDNLIITTSQEETFTQEGISIQALPAWKWLLD
jgi:predicted AAA+ superfamily ATPase